MPAGLQHIALFGAPGTHAAALAERLREVLPPHIALSTPTVPQTGPDLVLLMGLPSHPRTNAEMGQKMAQQVAADNALRTQLLALSLPYRVVYGQGAIGLNNALLALGLPTLDVTMPIAREQAQFKLQRGCLAWTCEHCSDAACEHRLFTGLMAR